MTLFFIILIIGIFFVVMQGIASYADGYFNQKQLLKKGIIGYSFIEHGGMWADVFVVSPAIALIMSSYDLRYFSWWSAVIFLLAVIASLKAGIEYQRIAVNNPEAHTHNGKTTIAGWIHGVYAVLGMWVFTMFLVTPITPHATPQHLIIVALFLTILFPLGIVSFNSKWKLKKGGIWQVIILTSIVWLIIITRLILLKT